LILQLISVKYAGLLRWEIVFFSLLKWGIPGPGAGQKARADDGEPDGPADEAADEPSGATGDEPAGGSTSDVGDEWAGVQNESTKRQTRAGPPPE